MKAIVLVLVLLIILGTIIGGYLIVLLLQRSRLREILLRAEIIKLKEAVQQAERKSMNKSLAFASASHDIRTSLAGIFGLIEICQNDVSRDSEVYRNLEQMNSCAAKLLGILNSVLDISKIEAGKMQLDEVQFNISDVLEESVDIFHVVALKKGLEVIWDPCDCSILKSTKVKGDCRRLKQIIDNLLGNAVKFTSEGHIVLRAWARKPSLNNADISCKQCWNSRDAFNPLLRCMWKDGGKDRYSGNLIQNDPNLVEIVIEVDDTGTGIPKEKRASVFENYVQVKESDNRGQHEGTGLGLGIVQSYVRLMGGEIKIQDKNPFERGTCFRFNIFLKSDEPITGNEVRDEKSTIYPIESNSARNSTVNPQIVQSTIRSMAFRRGLTTDGIHSILFVQGDETTNILQRWMESLGVKVWVINLLENLYDALGKIKDNHSLRKCNSRSYLSIAADFTKDENTRTLPLTNKDLRSCSRGLTPNVNVLIVVDLDHGNLSEMAATLQSFAANAAATIHYKIVWLVSSNSPSDDLRRTREVPCHLILQKPIHGSRLYALLKLLQDFRRGNECHSVEIHAHDTVQIVEQHNKPDSSIEQHNKLDSSMESNTFVPSSVLQTSENASLVLSPKYNSEDQKPLSPKYYSEDDQKPLTGRTILLVEDTPTLRLVATKKITRLGANVTSAENGSDALKLIHSALKESVPTLEGGAAVGDPYQFPYDAILMDCEMPVMNGYEATRQIREEEINYGIRIPIIALTAHATPEQVEKTRLVGMDFHLTKPLQDHELVNAITTLCDEGYSTPLFSVFTNYNE
ncbi:putative histidine kinase 2 [Canna indica]|uniref:histidine kinase n=1 Tax=Canna indica TaxID=4628 RepID=A0AAQ3JYC5_9LILI|nr:putative histidine kinase 2 [Canna indica]